MDSTSLKSFGVVIAFLLPGFVAIWGISLHSELVAVWIRGNEVSQASIGGVLFSTIFALGCGLIASTVRWFVLDFIHHKTGVQKQPWDYRKLQANIAAYQLLEENHYRFYQFYGNSLIALLFAWISWRLTGPAWVGWSDLGAFVISVILYLGSRDTLRKYYLRVNDLLDSMTD
jgi:hypothetical protein